MKIKQITSNTEFEQSIQNGVILVDFNAPWCGPCRSQEPILEAMSNHYQDTAKITAVNIDKHQDLATKLGIRSIPTLIIYKNKKEIQRFVGLQSQITLSDAIDQALA